VAHPQSGSSSTWFLFELEFGNVGFWGEGKLGVPGERTLGAKKRTSTNNKLRVSTCNGNIARYLKIYMTKHWSEKFAWHLGTRVKGALSQLSSSFLFIMPITHPYSMWNLRYYLWMTILKLQGKQIWLPSIISHVTNTKKEFGKRVRPTSFQKSTSQSDSIFHKFRPSVPPLVFAVLFVPSFNVFSIYFKVLLSLVALLTV